MVGPKSLFGHQQLNDLIANRAFSGRSHSPVPSKPTHKVGLGSGRSERFNPIALFSFQNFVDRIEYALPTNSILCGLVFVHRPPSSRNDHLDPRRRILLPAFVALIPFGQASVAESGSTVLAREDRTIKRSRAARATPQPIALRMSRSYLPAERHSGDLDERKSYRPRFSDTGFGWGEKAWTVAPAEAAMAPWVLPLAAKVARPDWPTSRLMPWWVRTLASILMATTT